MSFQITGKWLVVAIVFGLITLELQLAYFSGFAVLENLRYRELSYVVAIAFLIYSIVQTVIFIAAAPWIRRCQFFACMICFFLLDFLIISSIHAHQVSQARKFLEDSAAGKFRLEFSDTFAESNWLAETRKDKLRWCRVGAAPFHHMYYFGTKGAQKSYFAIVTTSIPMKVELMVSTDDETAQLKGRTECN